MIKKEKPLSIIHPFIIIITFQISKPYNSFIIPPRNIPPTKKINKIKKSFHFIDFYDYCQLLFKTINTEKKIHTENSQRTIDYVKNHFIYELSKWTCVKHIKYHSNIIFKKNKNISSIIFWVFARHFFFVLFYFIMVEFLVKNRGWIKMQINLFPIVKKDSTFPSWFYFISQIRDRDFFISFWFRQKNTL